MTIEELYLEIGGDYEQAIRVLRVDKLIAKHIRKFPDNGVVDRLIEAEKNMDPKEMFESAHAVKGVCSNLGLSELASISSELSEEFRPGNSRMLSDAEVSQKVDRLKELYERTLEGIHRYESTVE